MSKVYTRFQTKKAQKTLTIWVEHTYMACIREYHPPPPQVLQNKDSACGTVVVGRLGAERYKHS